MPPHAAVRCPTATTRACLPPKPPKQSSRPRSQAGSEGVPPTAAFITSDYLEQVKRRATAPAPAVPVHASRTGAAPTASASASAAKGAGKPRKPGQSARAARMAAADERKRLAAMALREAPEDEVRKEMEHEMQTNPALAEAHERSIMEEDEIKALKCVNCSSAQQRNEQCEAMSARLPAATLFGEGGMGDRWVQGEVLLYQRHRGVVGR